MNAVFHHNDTPRIITDESSDLYKLAEAIAREAHAVITGGSAPIGCCIFIDGPQGVGKSSVARTARHLLLSPEREWGGTFEQARPLFAPRGPVRDSGQVPSILTWRQDNRLRQSLPPLHDAPLDPPWCLDLSLRQEHWVLLAALLEKGIGNPEGAITGCPGADPEALRERVTQLRHQLARYRPDYLRWAAAMAESEDSLLDRLAEFYGQLAGFDHSDLRRELEWAIGEWERCSGTKGWVVFLDDADLMCGDVIETVESLRIHLRVPRLVVVLSGNRRRLEAAVERELRRRAEVAELLPAEHRVLAEPHLCELTTPYDPQDNRDQRDRRAHFASIARNLVDRVSDRVVIVPPMIGSTRGDFLARVICEERAGTTWTPTRALMWRAFMEQDRDLPAADRWSVGTLYDLRSAISEKLNAITSHADPEVTLQASSARIPLNGADLLYRSLPESCRGTIHLANQLDLIAPEIPPASQHEAQRLFLIATLKRLFPTCVVHSQAQPAPGFEVRGQVEAISGTILHQLFVRWQLTAPHFLSWNVRAPWQGT